MMVTNKEQLQSLDCLPEKLLYDEDDARNLEQISNSEKQREKMAALGQLAGGIAHDFNNQLMSIIGNATMIQKTDDLGKIKEYAKRIIHISQSTAELTKKILLFSRKESVINKPVNLKMVLDNTYKMVNLGIDKTIEIKYGYYASNKIVLGHEAQIENLIINLIINAGDALENIKDVKTISIGTEDTRIYQNIALSHGEIIKPGEYVKIYVEDNGCGMEDQVINKIFEPYFTTKSKSKGTGLGLSVIFGTVKSHSGYINVESKIGCGTRFEIFLPVFNDIEPKIEAVNNRDLKSNLIMLVDDDLNVLDVEAEMLEDLGYDVLKYSKPLEALKYYEDEFENISFVVLDMMMPEITGIELYKQLQNINNNVTAIFISGYAGQSECEGLIKNGFTLIEKPFTFEQLSSRITRIYI
jgi:nitrogen-specific signal transduction histidine kinase/CheY-like chemotaxis protein